MMNSIRAAYHRLLIRWHRQAVVCKKHAIRTARLKLRKGACPPSDCDDLVREIAYNANIKDVAKNKIEMHKRALESIQRQSRPQPELETA